MAAPVSSCRYDNPRTRLRELYVSGVLAGHAAEFAIESVLNDSTIEVHPVLMPLFTDGLFNPGAIYGSKLAMPYSAAEWYILQQFDF